MFRLDLRSIILLTGIMGALMAVVLFSLRRSYPSSIKGLLEWAAAPAVGLAAILLFAAHGLIPDFFTVAVGNLMVLAAAALAYIGSQRFFGVAPSTRLCMGLIFAAAPVLTWYTVFEPHFGVRIAAMTFLMGWFFLAHAVLVLRQGGRLFSARFTVVVLLLQSGVIILRFLTSLPLSAREGFLDAVSPVQTLYVAGYAFTMLTLNIGLVLMATDRLRAELEHLATHDRQTGVLTRAALIDICEQELERCRRHGRTVSLLLLDFDHFNAINDSHGHLMGDRILRNFVARVSALLRRPDQLGRYGGEEFAVLLPETPLEEAVNVAERIRAEVAIASGLPLYTVSIGVAASRSDDAQMDGLLARADKALHKAKAGGGNCVATA